ncbi:MAG: hypothetical protein KC457_06495 [Myxococcales bacterium]|nr:hypothetical protein [Myxococcales bacterium]
MNILVRAIITGFGLRIGSELGKLLAHKVFPQEKNKQEDEGGGEEDELNSVTPDPPEV